MPNRTYTADQIARYFLAKTDEGVGDLISNLKLQKLCYYAQGLGMATRGEPMFPEPLEAWLHGPVVPGLYRAYRQYEANAIPPVTDLDLESYEPADRKILDDVYDFYGQYSAWRLRQMTHGEAPWREAYEADANHVIPLDSLTRFFSDLVSDEYRAEYGALQRAGAQG